MTKRLGPTMLPGAYIAPHAQVSDDVILGPNAVVLASEDGSAVSVIEGGVVIGANATILPGITVGIGAHVGPGAVVNRSVPPMAIVEGNPARIVGYADTPRTPSTTTGETQPPVRSRTSPVRGVKFIPVRSVADLRGRLAAGEFEQDIPFRPRRYFVVYDVPTAETRGAHAHHQCQQFLVAVHGNVKVMADDGIRREEFLLGSPDVGLYLPSLTWAVQYGYSADAVLLVFASDHYDPADYIRDYSEFLRAVGRQRDET